MSRTTFQEVLPKLSPGHHIFDMTCARINMFASSYTIAGCATVVRLFPHLLKTSCKPLFLTSVCTFPMPPSYCKLTKSLQLTLHQAHTCGLRQQNWRNRHIRDMLGLGKEDFENFKSCTKAAADRFLLLELTAMDQPIELGRAIQEIVSCNPEIRMKSPAHTRALKCYLLRQHSQRRFYRFIRKKDIQKSDSRREQENIREAKPRAAAYRGVYTSSSPERKSNSSSSCDSISDSDSSDMSEDDSDDAMNPGSSLYDWSDDDDDDDDGPSNDTHSSAKDSVVGKADAIHHGRRDKGQNPHLEQNSAKTSTCVSRYERVGHALGKRRRTQTMDKVKAECLSANQPNLKGMDQAQVPSQHVDNPPQLAEKPATADISPEGSGSAQPVVRARLVQEQASSSEEKFSAVRAFLNAMSPSMQYMLPAFVEFGFTDGNSLRYVAEKSTEDIEVVIRRIQKVLNLDSSVERKVSELDVIRLTDAFSSYK